MTEYTVLKMEENFNQYAIITSRLGMLSIKDAFKQVLENEERTTEERRILQNLVRDIKDKISRH